MNEQATAGARMPATSDERLARFVAPDTARVEVRFGR
jgi:hypothetical protein